MSGACRPRPPLWRRSPRRAAWPALALGLLLPSLLAAQGATPLPLVNSSHSGRINRIVYNEAQHLLFTAGEDGTVRIWEPEEGRLQRLLRLSRLPLRLMAVRPDSEQVAAVESDSLQAFRLDVWDTRREARVFETDLRDPPLFLGFSPLGRWLVYGRPEYDSLVFLDTRTWTRAPVLTQGFGIVSFALVSRNERNVMAYQSSGWITYLEIGTGRTLRRLKAPVELAAISVSPDNLHLAAAQGDNLVVVDLLSGELVAQVSLPGIQAIDFAPQGGEIACLAEGRLSLWSFARRALTPRAPVESPLFRGLTALTFAGTRLYAGDDGGGIPYLYPGGRDGLLAADRLLPISDIGLAEGVLAALGPGEVVGLFSDLLAAAGAAGAAPPGSPGQLVLKSWPNPYPAGGRLEVAGDGSLFLWTNGDQPGAFTQLDLGNGQPLRVFADFGSPLMQLEVSPEGIIAIEKSGLCRILDRSSLETVFQYWAPGMNRLVAAGGELLIGGRSALSGNGSPLLRINRWTGETVSIPDSASIVYDLLFDPREGWLFSLGVERGAQRPQTVLKMHYGLGYGQERVIFRFEGEDLNGSMAAQQGGGMNLYFSVGDGSVTAWNGYRLDPLQASGSAPRRLYLSGDLLVALNRDSSLTAWDTRSRKRLLDFYLFRDLEWTALFADGAVAVSPGGERYLVRRRASPPPAPPYSPGW